MNVEPNAAARRAAYRLMTVVATAIVCARILSVERVYEPSIHRADPPEPNGPTRVWPAKRPMPSPTFSSNDRSRWAMVRALVDHGTFVVGRRIPLGSDASPDRTFVDTGIVFEDGWETVDKVLHPETKLFYSSKPPLLPVIVAGEYWVLQKLFGWRIEKQTKLVVCTVLLTINALPFAVYLIVLSHLIERFGRTDWGRLFTFAAACFATFLTTFSSTFNNHSVAAYTTLFAVAPFLLGHRSPAAFAVSGLFAGLTAAFELPAAAFLVALGIVALSIDWRRTLLVFAPIALAPIVAQLALNYVEVGDWRPIYEKVDTEWYRYEGSHWNQQKGERRGIDYAGDVESRPTYAFHLLLGHHGLYSLTPIWLLSMIGMLVVLARPRSWPAEWTRIHWAGAAVSMIVIVFFAAVTSTVNYGGWTCGPRWFFWLTPLWLLALLPAADWLSVSRIGRCLAAALLAISVFSAFYPGINPWRHPWVYHAMEESGWRGY
jgi:hypothetical protein